MTCKQSLLFGLLLVSSNLFAFSMYSGNQPQNSGGGSVTWKTSCHFLYKDNAKFLYEVFQETPGDGQCEIHGECSLDTSEIIIEKDEDCDLSPSSKIEWDATQKAAGHLCSTGSFETLTRKVAVTRPGYCREVKEDRLTLIKAECLRKYSKTGSEHPKKTIWGKTIVSELECEGGQERPKCDATPSAE